MRCPHPLGLLLSLCSAVAVTVAPAGTPPVSVWGSIDSLHKCGVNDVPDIPSRFFVDGDGLTHMIDGSTSFHWMTGPSVYNQTRNCSAAWNSTQNPDPSMFASAEWLDSPHFFPNGTVVAFVHVEYDAMSIEVPKCPHNYPLCWTVTITLAISDDSGYTWRHARPPPNHLVMAVPYEFNQTQPASGWGDPSNIIQSPTDNFFYFAALNRNQVGLQAPGVCVLRTNDLMDPTSWRGYGGGGEFNVSFVSPYTMPPDEAAEHICTTIFPNECMPSGLMYSTYLEQYVLTLDCLKDQHSAYISYSPDLITWTSPAPFYSISDLPPQVRKNVTSITYPTFVDPAGVSGGNFNSMGQTAPLFWASIGHSPWSDGRRVWATNMTFSK